MVSEALRGERARARASAVQRGSCSVVHAPFLFQLELGRERWICRVGGGWSTRRGGQAEAQGGEREKPAAQPQARWAP